MELIEKYGKIIAAIVVVIVMIAAVSPTGSRPKKNATDVCPRCKRKVSRYGDDRCPYCGKDLGSSTGALLSDGLMWIFKIFMVICVIIAGVLALMGKL